MRFLFLASAASVALIPAAALAQSAPDAAAPAASSTPPVASGKDIVVTAQRLDAARDAILPALGASDYTIDRTMLDKQPGGGNANLETVLLQAPGVTQDSYGQLHVRNEHANLQYRLNGVIVPESISGFGQTIDPRIANSVELITGTLPAQYGYRTTGVVNLKTRTGSFDDGGDISFYGGSHGTIEPSATIHGSSGSINFFVSGRYLENDLGIENPTSSKDAIHDHTRQYHAFAYVSDVLSESDRISAFGGTSIGYFQIPNNPGQGDPSTNFVLNGNSTFDSATLDQNQREITHFGVIAWQHSAGDFNFQVAPFVRYTQTRFTPDPRGGDLILTGIADDSRLSGLATGVQADGSYKASDAHTLRFGLFFQNERTRTRVTSRVFSVDDSGSQTSDVPLSITDTGSKNGQLYGIYLQDEWSLSPTLTFNYGARFDAVRAYTSEEQLSPRANLVWKPGGGTTLHLGYARNFTPPPQELIGGHTIALFAGTTKEPQVAVDDPVRAEREHYFDGGVEQVLAPGLKVGLDAYYKIKHNLLDDGQFGAAVVLSPFNYAKGYAWGVELSASYTHGPFDLYANVARGQEKGKDIISSQFFFAPDELAYIANHYIYTDHSQRWTASGGGSVTIHDGIGTLVPSFDLLYGDGLRADDPAGIVPNGGKLPSYVTANLGIAQNIDGPGLLKGVSIRFDVVNLADKIYLIRDGTEVGVGAPQYGARRGFFAGISKKF